MKLLSSDAWERFIVDEDGVALRAHVDSAPLVGSFDAEYPELHRICDVALGGQAFRVSRLFESELRRERLLIEPTDSPSYDQLGVPYWLRGAQLAAWVEEERANPAKQEIDWTAYARLPTVGGVVVGTVHSRLPFGVFISLAGRHYGLVRLPDVADDVGPGAELPDVGAEVSCVVLAVTPGPLGYKVALSMKPSAIEMARRGS